MAKKGIKSYQVVEENITWMNDVVLKNDLSDSLKNLKRLINQMLTGAEDGGKLWTGKSAETFYEHAVRNLNNNLDDYHAAYRMLKTLDDYYEQVKTAANQ